MFAKETKGRLSSGQLISKKAVMKEAGQQLRSWHKIKLRVSIKNKILGREIQDGLLRMNIKKNLVITNGEKNLPRTVVGIFRMELSEGSLIASCTEEIV